MEIIVLRLTQPSVTFGPGLSPSAIVAKVWLRKSLRFRLWSFAGDHSMSPCRLSDSENKYSCALCLIYTQRNKLMKDVKKNTMNKTVDKERGIFVDGKLGGVHWAIERNQLQESSIKRYQVA